MFSWIQKIAFAPTLNNSTFIKGCSNESFSERKKSLELEDLINYTSKVNTGKRPMANQMRTDFLNAIHLGSRTDVGTDIILVTLLDDIARRELGDYKLINSPESLSSFQNYQ